MSSTKAASHAVIATYGGNELMMINRVDERSGHGSGVGQLGNAADAERALELGPTRRRFFGPHQVRPGTQSEATGKGQLLQAALEDNSNLARADAIQLALNGNPDRAFARLSIASDRKNDNDPIGRHSALGVIGGLHQQKLNQLAD